MIKKEEELKLTLGDFCSLSSPCDYGVRWISRFIGMCHYGRLILYHQECFADILRAREFKFY